MRWLARLLIALTLVAGLALSPAQATQIFVISGTSQTSPADWNNANNLDEAWGGGGSGGALRGSVNVSAGGGGAEYRASANFSVATPGTTAFNYTIGPGGVAVTQSVNGTTAGNAGTQTTFNTSTVIAKPGLGGGSGVATQNGGAGGTGGTGTSASAAGGRGGNAASAATATGGGAAGSAAGVGGNGVDTSGSSQGTNGGAGANAGATAGSGVSGTTAQTGGVGGDGTSNSTHSGGGGGGGALNTASGTATGGTGGHYGGGGGGATAEGAANAVSGAGMQGLIVLTYTPAAGTSSYLPLLGVGSLGHPANDNFGFANDNMPMKLAAGG